MDINDYEINGYYRLGTYIATAQHKEDKHLIDGYGDTPEKALSDLWSKLESK